MLDFEYGVNTGNRFLDFVDHDEEPEAFIAGQAKAEETMKKVSKPSGAPTKKVTTTTTTTTTKTNKENLTSKSSNERRQQGTPATTVFSDNPNQSTRLDSARGSRGGARRGTFDSNRGAARSQRFQKFEGQGSTSSSMQNNEPSGRGRGGPARRGGRGHFTNRSTDDQPTNFESQGELNNNDQDVSPTEPSENNRRYNRGGNFRPRTFHPHREGTENSQEDSRTNRRLHDRQPRNNVSGVKPIEKKDGEGAHNWGNPTENPEDHLVAEETTEASAQAASWAQQVDEAEKQMTLDEYKKQLEAKKRAQVEKLPQFKTRTAGEGEDPKVWTKPAQVYRKKNNLDQSGDEVDEDEDEEEGSAADEDDAEEEELMVGKKKLISIPLHFKPIETGRGSGRGGRRGGNPRYRERTEQTESTEQGATGDESRRGAPYRRSYGNSARTSRSGRNQGDSNSLALDNPDDFPTLPKQ